MPCGYCQNRFAAVAPLRTADGKFQRIEWHESGNAMRVEDANFRGAGQFTRIEFGEVRGINDPAPSASRAAAERPAARTRGLELRTRHLHRGARIEFFQQVG